MNAAVTSKEEILKTSRELIRQQGQHPLGRRGLRRIGGLDL